MERAVAHMTVGRRAAIAAPSVQLNWRLVLALGVNVALWGGIVMGVQHLRL